MPPGKNPLEIYKILPQTNCRQCFLPSCLAFSAAVVNGRKKLTDCPFVKETDIQKVTPTVVTQEPYEIMRGEKLKLLQKKVADMDIGLVAGKIGGTMTGGKLNITCLGKDFLVDTGGRVISECHTHIGLAIPLLSYIVNSKGDNPSGNWVPFRELKDGPPMSALFEKRGEKNLQMLADNHTDLFDDLVNMFSGTKEKKKFASDISVVLYPLPKLPVLICYWKPEEELGSKLSIYLDDTADRHLPIEWIFELTIGMVMMFEKIARIHM